MTESEYQLYQSLTTDEVVMLAEHLAKMKITRPTLHYFDQLPHLSHAEIVVSLANKTDKMWLDLTDKLLQVPLYALSTSLHTEPSFDIDGQPLPLPVAHRSLDVPLLGSIPVRAAVTLAHTRKKDTRIVSWVSPMNPKQLNSASYKRFALYRPGMTVSDYVSLGGRYDDIKYDLLHGFIKVSL